MATELTYLLITPRSIQKSKTGGIIARLLSQTDLELVGAQMLAFSREMAQQYAQTLEDAACRIVSENGKLLSNYVLANFPPIKNKCKERSLLLLLRGDDACRKLNELVGKLSPYSPDTMAEGETLRDTYGDFVVHKKDPGQVLYFEPAVLTAPNIHQAKVQLKLLADFAAITPNIIDHSHGSAPDDERTLVIIKPDNWRHPSTRPGNIIDMLSRTGLRIVGCKVYHMSVDDALKFYGPVRDALRSKLSGKFGSKAKAILEKELEVTLPHEAEQELANTIGIACADDQFAQLVEFMAGQRPDSRDETAQLPKMQTNPAKCLVLIYEGPNAISKIRTVIGPTDPAKAPGGTVRCDFGSSIMVNAIHASDSPASVEREMSIIRLPQNTLAETILDYLHSAGLNR